MRLWSLHPRYLDAKGLVALWREGLLARKVLCGETRGYRHHPQLERFRQHADPVALVDAYLRHVCEEATCRGYRFDGSKLGPGARRARLPVTRGQIGYEWDHLRRKLQTRDAERLKSLEAVVSPDAHPVFVVVEGDVESWEKRA
jgi:hypothetical protein